MDAITDVIASVGRAEKIAPATNEFEGVETLCLYNRLAHGDPFAQIPAFEPLLEGSKACSTVGVWCRHCLDRHRAVKQKAQTEDTAFRV